MDEFRRNKEREGGKQRVSDNFSHRFGFICLCYSILSVFGSLCESKSVQVKEPVIVRGIDKRLPYILYLFRRAGKIRHTRRLHAMIHILQEKGKIDLGYEFEDGGIGIFSGELMDDTYTIKRDGFVIESGEFAHIYRLTHLGVSDCDWIYEKELSKTEKQSIEKIVEEYNNKELIEVVNESRGLLGTR